MKRLVYSIFIVLFALNLLAGAASFKMVEKWTPKGEIFGMAAPRLIDKDGLLIGGFYKTGSLVISRTEVVQFAPYGQGPGDLMGFRGISDFNGDIAVLDDMNIHRIKTFAKKDGKYIQKEIIWLQRNSDFLVTQALLFCDNKWFVAGEHHLAYKEKNIPYALIRVYDRNGKFVKYLVEGVTNLEIQSFLFDYFIFNDSNRVYFMVENKLQVKVIAIRKLVVEKSVDLETPAFYQKMPAGFYAHEKRPGRYYHNIENWKTNYCRITKACVDGRYLAVQVRTCKKELQRFALLFYNKETFKLEHTFFSNDYFLDARNGRYYFYENGDPGLDEGADNVVIKIYKWE